MPSLSERRHHLLEQVLQWRKMQETSANNSARTSAEGWQICCLVRAGEDMVSPQTSSDGFRL